MMNENDLSAACRALSAAAGRNLTERGAHAAAAESLTGGMVSSFIVDVPGASQWFTEGCVTYTDEAKMRRLGVPEDILRRSTAVSSETARAMAEGLLRCSGADIAVATTGVAGPGPDADGHPEGLVFIGGATRSGSVTKELALAGSRRGIRLQAALSALTLLYKLSELV
ncbi:MAG: nicotinamide-nucleotide amidohydrolase family protein [Clostridia bacterium]|nr:nicotinamide-nucleotide amidohydrolase family protein [Clostridia bacterium]